MKKLLFWIICILTMVGLGSDAVIADSIDRELLVQFYSEMVSEEEGEFPGISVLSAEVDSVFTENNVVYLKKIFTNKPSQRLVKGITVKMPDFSHYYLVRTGEQGDLLGLKTDLKGCEEVQVVDVNRISVITYSGSCFEPDDPYFVDGSQWYLHGDGEWDGHINIEPAWDLVCGLNPLPEDWPKIGLIDTGAVPFFLQDEMQNEILELDVHHNNDAPTIGHGAGVLSVIAGGVNNGVGISGIGRNLDTSESYNIYLFFSAEQVANYLSAALDNGVTIISSSVGFSDASVGPAYTNMTLVRAVQEAFLMGVPYVCAAGQNECSSAPPNPSEPGGSVVYPGKFGLETICVAATDRSGSAVDWDYAGDSIDLSAPGEGIFLIDPIEGAVTERCGTSFAQPMVAGTISLMQNVAPDLWAEDYEGVLKSTCVDIGDPGFDRDSGWGRLNAGRAVLNLIGTYELVHAFGNGGTIEQITNLENVIFYDFPSSGSFVSGESYDAVKYKIRTHVSWSAGFIDSVYSWGMHVGTNGLRDVQVYTTIGGDENWVTNVNMSYPDPLTMGNLEGSDFFTYAYEVLDEDGQVIATLGPVDPSTCQVYCGAIGKTHGSYPAPEISSIAEYSVLTGGTDNSIYAVGLDNNGSSEMTVLADLTNLGLGPDIQLLDNGIEPDLIASDWIFTSERFTSNVVAGDYSVNVTAHGNIGLPGQQNVAVEVIESGVLLVDGSGDTGDLNQLDGEPYAGIYFDSPVGGVNENILIVTKDFTTDPGVFKQNLIINGTPSMEKKNDDWFQVGFEPAQGSRGVYAADFDNDGDEDFFICHNNQETRLYENTGNGFSDVTTMFEGNENLLNGAHVAAWGDYNQDGKLDLFVATMDYTGSMAALADNIGTVTNSQWFLFKNTGTSFELALDSMYTTGGFALSASWNDVNNDGLLDLVVGEFQGGANGSPTVILNQGYKKNLGHYVLTEDPGTAHITGLTVNSLDWIDYDHNNLPDLVVTEFTPSFGAHILRNTGNGFEVAVTLTNEGSWTGSIVADFNQDGQDDVVLLPLNGMPALFVGDHATNPTYKELAYPLGLRQGATSGGFAADFNDDKDLDLYLGRANTDQFLYKNQRVNGNDQVTGDQDWIRFDLTTLGNSNASLIGARITVVGDTKQWIQTVDGGSGRGGQRSNELHFGLGNATGSVEVILDWPGSIPPNPITYSSLAINTVHAIADTARPHVIVGSPEFLPEPSPTGADLVFEWRTVEHGNVELDKVEVDFGGYFPGDYCYVGLDMTLEFDTPDVEMTIFPVLPSGWKHRVVWSNQSCLGDSICGFQFKVGSGVESPQGVQTLTEGPWVNFGEFDVCITKKSITN